MVFKCLFPRVYVSDDWAQCDRAILFVTFCYKKEWHFLQRKKCNANFIFLFSYKNKPSSLFGARLDLISTGIVPKNK